jgi:MurNAc alpha-1-phosphate uridylyltransferase
MCTQPDALMLFAAGFGTRMAPLTDNRPKPLIEVAGRPLIDHALDLAREAGIATIVANLHYLPDQLEAHLQGSGVRTVREEPDILDTGGGLRNALPLLGKDAVFTLNTDAVWTGENPLRSLMQAWDPQRMDALLCLIPCEAAVGHAGTGDFVPDDTGRLSRGSGLVYSGAQILKTAPVLAETETVFSLNRIWDRLLPTGRVHGVVHDGGWCDVGQPESIPLAETLLREAAGV